MAGIASHFEAVFSHDDRHVDRVPWFQAQLFRGNGQLQNGVGLDRLIASDLLPGIRLSLARQQKCLRARRGKWKSHPKRELRPLQGDGDVEALSRRARFIWVESHDELVLVPAELDRGEEPVSFPHGAKRRPGIDGPRAAPFEKVGHQAVDRGIQPDERLLDRIGLVGDGPGADRGVQLIGRRNAHMYPDIAEMSAKEPVEFRLEISIEVIAVPPEPVAAFGGVQFLPGRLCAVRRKAWCEIN